MFREIKLTTTNINEVKRLVDRAIRAREIPIFIPDQALFLEELYNTINSVFDITKEELTGNCRKGKLPTARKVFAYYANKVIKLSVKDISRELSLSHSTVSVHIREVAQNPWLLGYYNTICMTINKNQ
ncbi:MAG: hypothetical protein N4A72_22110 [Bacteroidales bacterium]|jgi:chromosomal replication initiation ATPase DnaA|nr:hypothetical protein [Bacteroidales bacterium]